ncbi:MAG: hypothetical protein MUP27_09005 [Desulfobacterales bacterium]|nr:hypothetical protein [Desulfobacterales bacterium]
MENYREKLKNRTRQAVANKDSRGLGRKSLLDLSVIGLPIWTPRSGKDKNFIDIMPWRVSQSWYKTLRTRSGDVTRLDVGDVDYKLEVARHNNVGPGKDMMLCLREAFAKGDPICEDMFTEFQKRKDGAKDFNADKARSFQPSWRDFYIIYDYDDADKGFQLWEMSYELFEKFLLDEMPTSPEEGGLVIPWDLLDGRSVEFKGREKKLGNYSFIEAEGITFHKRDPYDEGILDKLPSLDAALIIPTYEQIREAHFGLESQDTGPEAAVEKPEEKVSGVRSRTRSTEVSDDKGKSASQTEKEISGVEKGCPAGGKFGEDCNRIKACQDEACSEEVFQACLKKHDELSKQAPVESPKTTEQPTGETRRKRGETTAPAPAEQSAATGGRTRRR